MLTTKNRAKGIDYNVNVVFMNKNTFVPIAPSWRVILNDDCIQIKKTWSQSWCSFHAWRPSHCPVSRNEQRWKPHVCVYIVPTINSLANKCKGEWENGYNTPHEAFPLLCFWLTDEVAKFSCVKIKAQDTPFYLCMCPAHLSAPWAFSKA